MTFLIEGPRIKLDKITQIVPKHLLTINEAAKFLGVSTKTLRRWDKAGRFVSNRTLGSHRRYTLEDLKTLKKRSRKAKAPKLISVETASQELGVSTKTIRRWEDQGKLEAIRTPGGHRRFPIPQSQIVYQPTESPFAFDLKLIGFVVISIFLITLALGSEYLKKEAGSFKLSLADIKTQIAALKKEEPIAVVPVLPAETTSEMATLIASDLNLLSNSSFEAGNLGYEPKAWSYLLSSSLVNTKVANDSIRTGTLALKFEGGGASANNPLALGISQPTTTVINGRNYIFSVNIRTQNLVGNPTLRIGFIGTASTSDPNYGSAGFAKYAEDKFEDFELTSDSTSDWTTFSFEYNNAALGKYPSVQISNYQGGKIFLDDLTLYEILMQPILASPDSSSLAGIKIVDSQILYQSITKIGDGSLTVNSKGNIYPTPGLGLGATLGTSDYRFGSIYASDLDASSNLTANNITVRGLLTPASFSADPTATGSGSIVFRSDLAKLYFYSGSAWTEIGSGSGTSAFSNITSGTNTTAAMIIGTGASLDFTGSGTINASTLGGSALSALPYVNNVTNASLTRSGTGPYTLGINLGNSNSWTVAQTFTSIGINDSSPSTILSLGGTGSANGITLGDDGADPANLYRSAANVLKTDDSLVVTGQVQLGSSGIDPTALGAGSMYFNSGSSAFRCYSGSTWKDCTGTLYSTTDSALASGSYITVTHNQATSNLLASGWYYDTITSQWRQAENFTTLVEQSLQNEFDDAASGGKIRTASVGEVGGSYVRINGNLDMGNGSDGAVTFSVSTNINTTNTISGRICADGGDAVNYSVTALTANTATLSSTPSSGCIVANDKVLLINLQGTSTAYPNVGNYEILEVQSVSVSTVTFKTNKVNRYGDNAGDDSNIGTATTNQRVMLQRVPQYTNVTVNTGINVTPSSWNAVKGGVVAFMANGSVTLNGTGTINANQAGYTGGAGGNGGGGGGINDSFGTQGQSTSGAGVEARTVKAEGGGGGGDDHVNSGGNGAGGGGGGYGSAGGTGGDSSDGAGTGGIGGTTYGDAGLTDLYLGSGGGGGGFQAVVGDGIAGGTGGGIVLIQANSLTVTGGIQSNGSASTNSGDGRGEGGGGSGGGIKLLGKTLALGSSIVAATGAGAVGNGGAGGNGRIAIFYTDSRTGTTNPGATETQSGIFPYGVYHSAAIPTSNAVGLDMLRWEPNLPANTKVSFQTRSGNSTNPLDGTWEAWKPFTATTNYLLLESADTHTNWVGTNATVAEGDVARNIDYFEDEDEATATNVTKIDSSTNGGYAEVTFTAKDISTYDYVTFWVRASQTGTVLRFGFGEAAATEQTEDITIDTVNTWQKVYWDVSDVTGTARDAVTKLRITNLTTASNTFYLDNVRAEKLLTTSSGSKITSTPNNYLQYRAILTTTNTSNIPRVENVTLIYRDGFKVVQVDDNNVRLYNLTGQTQQVKLDVAANGTSPANPWTDVGTYLYPTGYESLRLYDTGGTNYFNLSHNGTNAVLGVNGSGNIVIDSTGDVGIGTSTPLARLHTALDDASTNTQIELARLERSTSGTAASGIGAYTSTYVETANGTLMEAGRLGFRAHVVSNGAAGGGTNNAAAFFAYAERETWDDMIPVVSAYATGADRLLCMNGIDNASTALWDCFGMTIGSANAISINFDNTGRFKLDYSGTTASLIAINTGDTLQLETLGSQPIYLDTRGTGDGADVYLSTSGNLGIGTTSPGTARLRVEGGNTVLAGGSLLLGATTAAGEAVLEMGQNGATGDRYAYIDLRGDDTYTDYGLRMIRFNTGANANSQIAHRGTGYLDIVTQEAGSDILLRPGSEVGVGTSAPEAKLQVTGGGLCVGSDVNCNTDNNTEGVVYSSATSMTVYDVAENYPTKDTSLVPGEAVSLDKSLNGPFVKRASRGETVLGAISEKPAVLLGGFNGEQYREEHQVAVALSGRIDINVSSENGPIEVGDPLTLSSIPGVAMKSTSVGHMIGRALENYDNPDPKAVDKIMVFVNLSWNDPNILLTESGDIIDTTPVLAASSSATPVPLSGPVPSASDSSDLASLTTRVSNLETELLLLKSTDLTATPSGDISESSLTDLTVLGDTVINGKLDVGILSFDSLLGSINAIGTLKIQPLALAGIEFLDNAIEIDKNGNFSVKKGVIAANDKIRGTVTLTAGQTLVRVEKTWDSPPSTITLTPSYNTTFWVTDKSEKGFTINVGSTPRETQTIDWLAIW